MGSATKIIEVAAKNKDPFGTYFFYLSSVDLGNTGIKQVPIEIFEGNIIDPNAVIRLNLSNNKVSVIPNL